LSVGVVLLVFGGVTWALGLGPFAYRQIWYGTSEIYILNMTDHAVSVTLDGGTPREIGSEAADRAPVLGGTTHIVTRNEDGNLIEEMDIKVDGAPVFYNVEGAKCLALADVASYYGAGDKRVEILETFPRGTRLISLPHDNIIWPRQTLRDEVAGGDGVAWIEMVACTMLDASNERLLLTHLDLLLTERKRVEQARAKQREINRLMMKGESESVEGIIERKWDGGRLDDAGVDAEE
jgi:hypothetical protein